MSNVKVNGNTYNDISSVKLMKADGSGYAEFKEGAVATDTLLDTLLSGGSIGDRTIESPTVNLNWMQQVEAGTVSCPFATSAFACVKYAKFANLLLPNVTTMKTYAGPATKKNMCASNFEGTDVTGVFDLSSLATVSNNTVSFRYCTIGTLKLGSYFYGSNNFFGSASIDNFVWNNADILTLSGVAGALNGATKITNLYVPAAIVSECQAKVTAGSWTTVTNVYSIDEWED